MWWFRWKVWKSFAHALQLGRPGSRWNFTSIAASTTCSTRAHLSFQHFNQSHSGLDSLLQLSYICRFRPSKYVFLFVMLWFLMLWTQYPGSVVPLAMFLSKTYFKYILVEELWLNQVRLWEPFARSCQASLTTKVQRIQKICERKFSKIGF